MHIQWLKDLSDRMSVSTVFYEAKDKMLLASSSSNSSLPAAGGFKDTRSRTYLNSNNYHNRLTEFECEADTSGATLENDGSSYSPPTVDNEVDDRVLYADEERGNVAISSRLEREREKAKIEKEVRNRWIHIHNRCLSLSNFRLSLINTENNATVKSLMVNTKHQGPKVATHKPDRMGLREAQVTQRFTT